MHERPQLPLGLAGESTLAFQNMVPHTQTPRRKPLHERSGSETNIAAVRIVPATPPQLLSSNQPSQEYRNIYTRTALPTHPSHFLPPPGTTSSYLKESAVLTQSEGEISAVWSQAKQSVGQGTVSEYQTKQRPGNSNSTPSSSRASSLKSVQRKRKQVKVNPDKTFSVLEVPGQSDLTKPDNNGSKSPPSTISRSMHDRLSTSTESYTTRGTSGTSQTTATTLTTVQSPSPDLTDKIPVNEDSIPSSSPWNYKLVGGLRKVPKTPDSNRNAVPSDSLPSLLELPVIGQTDEYTLSNKKSFPSSVTASTTSDYSNYKVFPSSPPQLPVAPNLPSSESDQQLLSSPSSYIEESTVLHHQLEPSSDHSDQSDQSDKNYQVLGQSSTGYSPSSSLFELYATGSNYEVHGDPTPSPSTSLINLPTQPKPVYSRESLVIPPLQPKAKRSTERFGYYKKHSRESLRTGSLTSITSALSDDFIRAVATGRQLGRDPSLKNIPETTPWINPLALNAVKTQMQAHPQQWSSQLSTVASVSDGDTARNSRQWSEATARKSSGLVSHTHRITSIDSSILQKDRLDENGLLEYPEPSYCLAARENNGTMTRMAEEHDEYGDKLTDMPILHERPSRSRISGLFNIPFGDTGRSNSIRSISSSRANSLLATTIPTWARLYYGSGERRYLGTPGSLTEPSDSRPSTAFQSGSPDTADFPSIIYSPRRRPRDIDLHRQLSETSHNPADITPDTPPMDTNTLIQHSLKHRARKPSSVWSPHLVLDRRESRRQSTWNAPSVTWSQGGFKSERNVQVIMFIVGFIMPISWVIAAFLPIPPRPEFPDMTEQDARKSRLDILEEMNQIWSPIDEKRYQNARWWRILNRTFSVVGIVVMTLIVVLVVVTKT